MSRILVCLFVLFVVTSANQLTGWPQHLIDQSTDQFHSIAHDSTELYRIIYHTDNNVFVPGCARTFMFRSINQSFNVTVERLSQVPLISGQYKQSSNGGSINDFNFNAAYVPLFVERESREQSSGLSIKEKISRSAEQSLDQSDPHVHHALLLRAQNRTQQSNKRAINHSTIVQSVEGLASPSMLFTAYELPNHPGQFQPVTFGDLSLFPINQSDAFGVEDPRIVYDSLRKEWVLLYTAVETISQPTKLSTNDESEHSISRSNSVMARLSLATTSNIQDPTQWIRHGPIITDQWSKSGALLVRPLNKNMTSFLYWGDSNNGKGMSLAITDDLRHFKTINEVWLPIRPEPYFDNILVEGGPAPERLTTGDFFYLFNSAGKLSVNKTDYTAYHLTFALIDQRDPTVQLFRSPVPLLSCELGWEIGQQPWLDLTPYVVFAEGMRPFPEKGLDSFLAYYGGADSVIGAAIITIKFENNNMKARSTLSDE